MDALSRQTLEEMSLEELQGLEKDLRLLVQERGDRAFFSEASGEALIAYGSIGVGIVTGFFLYSVAMSFRGFGSIVVTLIFIAGGAVAAAAIAQTYLAEPVRRCVRFLVRNREYIWYAVLIFAYVAARFRQPA